jgi:FG-GAP-like repeat
VASRPARVVGAVIATLAAVAPATAAVDFAPPLLTRVVGPLEAIAVGEMNGDGRADVVTLSRSGTISVLLAGADGRLTPGLVLPVRGADEEFSKDLVILDANGDGKNDVVTSLRARDIADARVAVPSQVYYGDGTGGLTPASGLPLISDSGSLSTGDLNGDGTTDILVSSGVILGLRADAKFSAISWRAEPFQRGIAELTGDGVPDVWASQGASELRPEPPGVRVYRGLGDGRFVAGALIGDALVPVDPHAADFNRDGLPDLTYTNLFANSATMRLGVGGGRFGPATRLPASQIALAEAIGDVNADGLADLVVANAFSGDVTVMEGRGDGRFRPGMQFVTVPGEGDVEIADVNADGRDDVVARNEEGLVAVLVSRPLVPGAGTARTTVPCATPRLVHVGMNIGCLETGMSAAQVRERYGLPRSVARAASYLKMSYPGRLVTLSWRYNYVLSIRTTRPGDGTKSVRIGTSLAVLRARYPRSRCLPGPSSTVCFVEGTNLSSTRFENVVTRFLVRRGRVWAIELS